MGDLNKLQIRGSINLGGVQISINEQPKGLEDMSLQDIKAYQNQLLESLQALNKEIKRRGRTKEK